MILFQREEILTVQAWTPGRTLIQWRFSNGQLTVPLVLLVWEMNSTRLNLELASVMMCLSVPWLQVHCFPDLCLLLLLLFLTFLHNMLMECLTQMDSALPLIRAQPVLATLIPERRHALAFPTKLIFIAA